jgi:superfamily II DNA or RNA helicase
MEERAGIKGEFEAGEIQVLLSSTVYDQGIDLPALDALVLCGGGKSTGKALQRIGRVIRTFAKGNKKDALVVETFDQAHFVREHSATRYGIYTTEPGYIVKIGPQMEAFLKKQQEDL